MGNNAASSIEKARFGKTLFLLKPVLNKSGSGTGTEAGTAIGAVTEAGTEAGTAIGTAIGTVTEARTDIGPETEKLIRFHNTGCK
jgi:hypothetical protein